MLGEDGVHRGRFRDVGVKPSTDSVAQRVDARGNDVRGDRGAARRAPSSAPDGRARSGPAAGATDGQAPRHRDEGPLGLRDGAVLLARRHINNTTKVGRLSGLVHAPNQSGASSNSLGMSKAGNAWSCPLRVDTCSLERRESAAPRTRPLYPAELREPVDGLVRTGQSLVSLAREFEPSPHTIRN